MVIMTRHESGLSPFTTQQELPWTSTRMVSDLLS